MSYTIINDGQFRFPMATADMDVTIDELRAMDADEYGEWCQSRPYAFADVGLPGSAELIALCDQLEEDGAEEWRIA